jgi:hypothetical protein
VRQTLLNGEVIKKKNIFTGIEKSDENQVKQDNLGDKQMHLNHRITISNMEIFI